MVKWKKKAGMRVQSLCREVLRCVKDSSSFNGQRALYGVLLSPAEVIIGVLTSSLCAGFRERRRGRRGEEW